MRYEIFIFKKIGTDKEFDQTEEVIGSVVASDPEEAKLVAKETFKAARGVEIHVKEAPLKGMFK